MKIIKRGEPERIRKILDVRMFECKSCGCVFEATAKEYAEGPVYSTNRPLLCECPECGKNAKEVKEPDIT